MTNADDTVDRLADRLQAFANRSASDGGVKGKIAKPLADDAAFIRGMKPSLIKARAKGAAPIGAKPRLGSLTPSPSPDERAATEPERKSKPPTGGAGGPNPWLVAALCLAAGIALAKWIDWRGHAHPRN